MTHTSYDVAVIGLGAAGAASLWALARKGVRAVGVDRWRPPHDQGSSHGESRLLRVAYGEGRQYVELARRARELWRGLGAETGAGLYHESGVVYAGPADSPFLEETWRSGATADLGLGELAADARAGLGFAVPDDWRCVLEPGAGFVRAEAAIAALLADAQAHGARLITDARVRAIEGRAEGLAILTDTGPIAADRAILAAGGWAPELAPALTPLLAVERRTLHWFADPGGRHTEAAGFRAFYIEDEAGRAIYGFPDWDGNGVKIAEHNEGLAQRAPADIDRAVHAADEARIAGLARRHFAELGPILRSRTCFYPMSRDGHFILDHDPDEPRIVLLAGLSGHGFKFAPALGEAAAAMALGRAPPVDVSMFALARFAAAPAPTR